MSQYSKIQFVSWELHTGPLAGAQRAAADPARATTPPAWYRGLRTPAGEGTTDAYGQCVDIEARLGFTADAMKQAEALSDRSVRTLKVFMAPAFLYRAAAGPYLDELVEGWDDAAPAPFRLPAPYAQGWRGLLGGLRALASNPKYEDWLFVFGSALSAAYPARVRGGAFALDPTRPGPVRSTTLVQRGGAGHGEHGHLARKHYPAGIDYILWHLNGVARLPGTVLPQAAHALLPADVLGHAESGALLSVPTVCDRDGQAIEFGIEVGLDHVGGDSSRRLGRIACAERQVRVQLVPSCGIRLQPQSVRLQPASASAPALNAYAFHCDGLGNINGSPGSHTQLWDGVHGAPEPLASRLLEASGGELQPGSRLGTVASRVTTSQGRITADCLWDNGIGVCGAGHVRVVTPLDL